MEPLFVDIQQKMMTFIYKNKEECGLIFNFNL